MWNALQIIKVILIGAMLIIAPILYICSLNSVFILYYIALILLCALMLFNGQRHYGINKIDISVAVYLLYGIINLWLVRQTPIDSILLCKWSMLITGYILFRNIKERDVLLVIIVTSGLLQSIIGVGQLMGLIKSFHSNFTVTGTFPNPGPYGGFLAISLVIGIALLRQKIKYRWCLLSSLLIILIMLILSDSRAALLASLIVITMQLNVFKGRRIKFIGLVGLFLLSIILYIYRPASANARLLIWSSCFELFKEKPIFGHGVGTLPQAYMNAQADYFIKNPNSKFIEVSNNNYQAFNEIIHLGVEQGMVGLLLFGVILYHCRKSKFFPIVLSWLIFSFFSYPVDIPVLILLLVCGIALCNSDNKVKIINKYWKLAPLILLPFITYSDYNYNKAINDIKVAVKMIYANNMDYVIRYLFHHKNISEFEYVTKNTCSSSDMLCDLGELYERNEDIIKADSCYILANKMVPCRIIPLQKRMMLYENIDTSKAKN